MNHSLISTCYYWF